MLGRVKLDNTLLTCDKGNFNQITAEAESNPSSERHVQSTVAPAPPKIDIIRLLSLPSRRLV